MRAHEAETLSALHKRPAEELDFHAAGFGKLRVELARFPRRFAPRNDKPEGPAPLNQWRKYCCSPRRSGNTATFFSRAAASPPGLFPFTALHIIENYGIFSVKILTKKLRGDMLDLPEGNTCQTFNWNGREGENAHEKPEILEITGFHDCSHRHFLPPVRLHKAELGTDDKSLGFPLLHQ